MTCSESLDEEMRKGGGKKKKLTYHISITEDIDMNNSMKISHAMQGERKAS